MSLHAPLALSPEQKSFMAAYLDALALVERLHRLLLDVIKDEFERLGVLEVNAVQALLMFNIGENEVTAGELKSRGYYQGSNVSYNLKKLVENGFMHHHRCQIDRRAVRVRLTEGDRASLDTLASLDLRPSQAQDRGFRPTSALGEFELVPQLATIARRNEQRVNTVQAFITAGDLPSTVLTALQERLEATNFELPPGYRYEFGGSSHVGERIRRIPVRSAHRDKAERWVARYPSGRRVQIYVNPEKPSEAVLKRDSQAALYAIWFPALFVVGGAGMAVAAVRKALRQHRRSPRTPGPAAPKAGET